MERFDGKRKQYIEAFRNVILGQHPRINDANLLYNKIRETIEFSKVRMIEIRQEYITLEQDYEKYLIDIDSSYNKDYDLELEAMENDMQNHFLALTWAEAHHSMNCIANIAPLIECVFILSFDYMQEKVDIQQMPKRHRWDFMRQKEKWDCHYYYSCEKKKTEKGIVKGIIQLLEAIGIRDEFSNDIDKMLKAIFEYRNKMFHYGYEWNKEEKDKFLKKANEEEWKSKNKEWFDSGDMDTGPIIMTDFFIQEIQDFTKIILDKTIDICNRLT